MTAAETACRLLRRVAALAIATMASPPLTTFGLKTSFQKFAGSQTNYNCAIPAIGGGDGLGAEEEALHLRIGRQRIRLAAAAVPAIHHDIAAMGDGEGLARVLLDPGHGDAATVARGDRRKQRLGRDRRETSRGLVEKQQCRLDHHRHPHRQDLALAAAQRAPRMTAPW